MLECFGIEGFNIFGIQQSKLIYGIFEFFFERVSDQ